MRGKNLKDKTREHEINSLKLLRSANYGILSTISKQIDGYPFGSFVTYVSSSSREIYLYLSDLAEHTENLHFRSQSSLTIFKLKSSGDIQNSSRLTLVGDLSSVTGEEIETCRRRFYTLLPDSKKYKTMHDFKFYKLKVNHARWIGGFGEIGWLDRSLWDCDASWKDEETRIIEHMNEDHQNTIVAALKAQHNIVDNTARMTLLCVDGYYASTDSGIYFISFPKPALNMKEYRQVLVQLAKTYKRNEQEKL